MCLYDVKDWNWYGWKFVWGLWYICLNWEFIIYFGLFFVCLLNRNKIGGFIIVCVFKMILVCVMIYGEWLVFNCFEFG